MEIQAGNAFLENGIGAGTEAKEPGDGVDQVPRLLRADQWAQAEISGVHLAGIVNPGEFLVPRDLDEGKTLVVLEANIERRLVGPHQVGFQEQGIVLACGNDIVQLSRTLQKVLQQRIVFFLKVLADPFF